MAGGVDFSGLDDFAAAIANTLKTMPDEQRSAHEGIATALKSGLDGNISASLNDSRGRVKSWQQSHVGSGGGYAAIRPIGGSGSGRNDSPGAITNYLESGHRIRRPTGAAKRRRPSRAKVAYVNGRHFYQSTEQSIESAATAMAEGLADKLAEKLEG